MARTTKTKPVKAAKRPSNAKPARRRLWLTYPPQKIQDPLIWQLGHKFGVVTNIRQASVSDQVGIVCLEVEGPGKEIASAIVWLEKRGVTVEPVEIGVMEG
jgi:L-aspartate semialdehyde sulfurtransferase ferredoxin